MFSKYSLSGPRISPTQAIFSLFGGLLISLSAHSADRIEIPLAEEGQEVSGAPSTSGINREPASVKTPPISLNQVQEFRLRGRHDHFRLVREEGRWLLGSEAVQLKALENFFPALFLDLSQECPALPPRPDMTVEIRLRESDSGERPRRVTKLLYISERVISDNTHCIQVDGDGLFSFPLHRSWFVGDRQAPRLRLARQLTLELSESRIVELEQERGPIESSPYHGQSAEYFLDHNFINRWIESLRDVRVDSRYHPGLAEKATRSIGLRSGTAELKFYLLPSRVWAVQRPGVAWLEADHRWGFWQNFNDGLIFDRHQTQLSLIVNAGAEERERVLAVHGLGDAWSEGIRQALHTVIGRAHDSSEVKAAAIRFLRTKPSDQNLAFLVQILEQSTDPLIQESIVSNLRVRHPSGSQFTEDMLPSERAPIIEEWRSWWRDQERKPSAN